MVVEGEWRVLQLGLPPHVSSTGSLSLEDGLYAVEQRRRAVVVPEEPVYRPQKVVQPSDGVDRGEALFAVLFTVSEARSITSVALATKGRLYAGGS